MESSCKFNHFIRLQFTGVCFIFNSLQHMFVWPAGSRSPREMRAIHPIVCKTAPPGLGETHEGQ